MKAVKIDPGTRSIQYVELTDEKALMAELEQAITYSKEHLGDRNYILVNILPQLEAYPWHYTLRSFERIGLQYNVAVILKLGSRGWEDTSLALAAVEQMVQWTEREPVFLSM